MKEYYLIEIASKRIFVSILKPCIGGTCIKIWLSMALGIYLGKGIFYRV